MAAREFGARGRGRERGRGGAAALLWRDTRGRQCVAGASVSRASISALICLLLWGGPIGLACVTGRPAGHIPHTSRRVGPTAHRSLLLAARHLPLATCCPQTTTIAQRERPMKARRPVESAGGRLWGRFVGDVLGSAARAARDCGQRLGAATLGGRTKTQPNGMPLGAARSFLASSDGELRACQERERAKRTPQDAERWRALDIWPTSGGTHESLVLQWASRGRAARQFEAATIWRRAACCVHLRSLVPVFGRRRRAKGPSDSHWAQLGARAGKWGEPVPFGARARRVARVCQ